MLEQCEPREWAQADVFVLKTIADQMVLAVNNSKLRSLVKTLAVTDEKSGLLRRSSYLDVLLSEVRRAVQQKSTAAVMLMQFAKPGLAKEVGEPAVENMMQQVGQVITSHIRQNDVAVRYDLTSIALILSETTEKNSFFVVDKLRKVLENQVVEPKEQAYDKIAKAKFAVEGTGNYPDATFTLRLAYGAVKGYLENGKRIAPFTTLGGLYDRSAKFNAKFPYNLPPRWTEKKSALNLATPFNFVSTDDIIGGNSGSPTINRKGELVGLIFDGNIQSLVGDFIYDESVNRAISVDVRAMNEVLRKVFDAHELADELPK